MKTADRPAILTHDRVLRRELAGERVAAALLTDGDLRITHPAASDLRQVDHDELLRLSRQATRLYRDWSRDIAKRMNRARALEIRALRVDAGASWRRLAELTFFAWGRAATWSPPSNQIAGLVLCEIAARRLGEDPDREPWN